MGLEEGLLQRLTHEEDLFVERKTAPHPADVRKTVVAFANGLPSSDTGVLFLGVDDHGAPSGKVTDPDKVQRDVRDWLQECFPPIDGVKTCALKVNGQHVVAVEVAASRDRPHFTGPAWVRVGSETVRSSPRLFDQMIDDRNDLCWLLRPWVNRYVTLVLAGPSTLPRRLDETRPPEWGPEMEAALEEVNRFYAVARTQRRPAFSFSLQRVMLEWDVAQNRPLVRVALPPLS
jgi:hypothetical protein